MGRTRSSLYRKIRMEAKIITYHCFNKDRTSLYIRYKIIDLYRFLFVICVFYDAFKSRGCYCSKQQYSGNL